MPASFSSGGGGGGWAVGWGCHIGRRIEPNEPQMGGSHFTGHPRWRCDRPAKPSSSVSTETKMCYSNIIWGVSPIMVAPIGPIKTHILQLNSSPVCSERSAQYRMGRGWVPIYPDIIAILDLLQ